MSLTSYRSPRGSNDFLDSVKIWEACRATSAASSFFDPIAIGRYREEFVDGATGENNPVWELWNQAQSIWGPEPVESKIKCLVSIGTGVPSLKPFQDDVFNIGKTLVAIATDTERTAERFQRHKSDLDEAGRYFRFNVARGLEDIGLEESIKRKEIAAATRRYVQAQEVFKRMQLCTGNVQGQQLKRHHESDSTSNKSKRARIADYIVIDSSTASYDSDDADSAKGEGFDNEAYGENCGDDNDVLNTDEGEEEDKEDNSSEEDNSSKEDIVEEDSSDENSESDY